MSIFPNGFSFNNIFIFYGWNILFSKVYYLIWFSYDLMNVDLFQFSKIFWLLIVWIFNIKVSMILNVEYPFWLKTHIKIQRKVLHIRHKLSNFSFITRCQKIIQFFQTRLTHLRQERLTYQSTVITGQTDRTKNGILSVKISIILMLLNSGYYKEGSTPR